MLAEKKPFAVKNFPLVTGRVLKEVRIGYETYGDLSPNRDNAILICHYFSGTSHAAGRYDPDDELLGYWDAVIGPGKSFDTDRFFILSSDTLCNINVKDPRVITTGPASTDPETGRPYGMAFPVVTIRDFVNLQRELLRSLGIRRLFAIAGPSMGGFQALEWAIAYPEMVDRAILVISAGQLHPWVMVIPGDVAVDAIKLDPKWRGGNYYGHEGPRDGLVLALKILTAIARSQFWADETYGRAFADPGETPHHDIRSKFLIEQEVEKFARDRASLVDANSYIFLARATALFRAGFGYDSMQEALGRVRAKILLIPCRSDIFVPPYQSHLIFDLLRKHGVEATSYELDSDGGHLAGVLEIGKAAEAIRAFLT
ncbi:MAG: homoserine O-acetyltransferase [Candidatus Methylomirabilales bacterium]